MPLSPIEVVEQIVAAWNQRNWDAAESLSDPEIVADYSRRLVDPGVYHGHHAMRESRLLLLEPWTDVSIEIEDTIVYGAKVVALMRVGATGKASGVNVEARFAESGRFGQAPLFASSTSAIGTRPSPQHRADCVKRKGSSA